MGEKRTMIPVDERLGMDDGLERPESKQSALRRMFTLKNARERLLWLFIAFCAASYLIHSYCAPLVTQLAGPVDRVLQSAPLFDGHNDLPIFLRFTRNNHINDLNDTEELPGQVDFPRLRQGKLAAQFWSAFVPCPNAEPGNFEDSIYSDAVQQTYAQVELIRRLVTKFPSELASSLTSHSVWHNFHHNRDAHGHIPIASLIGGEGLHSIGNKPSNLRNYYDLGMRYMTLAHNCHNKYADAALAPGPPIHGGLSKAGVDLIHEYNRIGMIVDLAHVTAETMVAALKATTAPIMFSHSGARAVCDHVRNVPDHVLDMVKDNGGVVMVTFLPEFTNAEPEKASLSDVADHIMYIGERIGYEHAGIGSDFDGMGPVSVKGLEDVSKYPDLVKELLDRGVSEKQLQGVIGANVLRVLKGVEDVAKNHKGLPLEDDLSGLSTSA